MLGDRYAPYSSSRRRLRLACLTSPRTAAVGNRRAAAQACDPSNMIGGILGPPGWWQCRNSWRKFNGGSRSMNEQATQLRCPKCKTPVEADAKKCPGCGGLFQAGVEAGLTEDPRTCPDCAEEMKGHARKCRLCGFTFPSACGAKLVNRYTDAYRVEKVIVGVGNLVKVLGIVAAAVVVLVGLVVTSTTNTAVPLIASFPLALVIWLLPWALGVLVSAQGELLKANIDQAVNTSPFLVDEQRAQIMSLT